MKTLESKTVVLTGAASGIGRALAFGLAKQKARLVLIDKDPEGLGKTAEKIPAGLIAGTYVLDVSQKDQVHAVACSLKDNPGKIDIIINNAGVSSSGTLPELTYDTLEWTMNINFWGVVHITKHLAPLLRTTAPTAIVNIASVYALIGVPGQSAYCASKFAVRGFSEALRQEYHGTNTCVQTVFPGGVQTNIVKNSRTDYHLTPEQYAKSAKIFEQHLKTKATQAAETIIDGIRKRSARILIGKDAKFIDLLSRLTPAGYDKQVAKANEKLQKACMQ